MRYQAHTRSRVIAWIIVVALLFLSGVIGSVVLATRVPNVFSDFMNRGDASKNVSSVVAPTPAPSATQTKMETVFVPYWQLDDSADSLGRISPVEYLAPVESRLVYFSVDVSEDGLNTEGPGYRGIQTFLSQAPEASTRYLAISMLDLDTNYTVLGDEGLQRTIIEQSIELALEHEFTGIVVDLEMPPLLSDKVPVQIEEFMQRYAQGARESGVKLAVTAFGDGIYRQRPYNMRAIGSFVDEVIIMAYDFHKAGGEPGPNFPFEGRKTYSYDFQKMVTDYAAIIPAEKLTVTYGMYGYDWVVDIEKRPLRAASAMTLRQIERDYVGQCDVINCNKSRDPDAAETQLEFVDEQSRYHVIWYEDIESIIRKTDYLNSQGIDSVGYWTYGYYN